MRVFLDTSVFVAALVETHPHQPAAQMWLDAILSGTHTGVISAHSLAEIYAVLTRIPGERIITPSRALNLIKRNVISACEITQLTGSDYEKALEHLVELGIAGGVIYDGIIMQAAAQAHVDIIVTFNKSDFARVYPSLADKIVSPLERGPHDATPQ